MIWYPLSVPLFENSKKYPQIQVNRYLAYGKHIDFFSDRFSFFRSFSVFILQKRNILLTVAICTNREKSGAIYCCLVELAPKSFATHPERAVVVEFSNKTTFLIGQFRFNFGITYKPINSLTYLYELIWVLYYKHTDGKYC